MKVDVICKIHTHDVNNINNKSLCGEYAYLDKASHGPLQGKALDILGPCLLAVDHAILPDLVPEELGGEKKPC